MNPVGGNPAAKRVIVFVWDGLRPDVINATDTPRLEQLKTAGVEFKDNHSTYPTFTMMNAASLATGSFPGTTGFFGNTVWAPGATGKDAAGNMVNFAAPVFTEDYAILSDLDAFYGNQLLLVGTLFKAAQTANLSTAAVGKSGPAFLQDYERGGVILDEKMAWPLSFAQELQAANQPLPKLTPNAYMPGQVTLAMNNGDPTAASPKKTLADGTTSDPTDASGSPPKSANTYLMSTYLNYVLPVHKPDFSLIWLRSPDSTQHTYGVGVANAKDALAAQDTLLGQLLDTVKMLGLDATTDVVVVSDHAHSNVSGPASLFPLRAVTNNDVGAVDANAGYSVSGDVRLADLLTRAGFQAFDGSGCAYVPVLSGLKADGSQVYPTQTDTTGTVCGTVGKKYTTPSYKVPASLPMNAIVIAANGGSDYLYLPDHDAATVQKVVAYLQTREEIGAIFVAKQYGAIDGTLQLGDIRLENAAGRNPDLVVSYDDDDAAMIAGVPGIEFESMFGNRGMHGSFGKRDVHNTLIAFGPDFKAAFQDTLPTGNVDVAPTLAFLFGLPLPMADGRPLYEALASGVDPAAYQVTSSITSSKEVSGLVMKLPTDPAGADVDAAHTKYHVELHVKQASYCGATATYYDYAKGVRQ